MSTERADIASPTAGPAEGAAPAAGTAPADGAAPEGGADERLVLVRTEGPVAHVRMNHPRTRNALSVEMMETLIAELTAIGERTDVHAVVLSSEGHVFSSGHDLKEVRGAEHEVQQQIFRTCSDLMLLIQAIPQPVIAQVQGVATAAGCQLVATCDLAVAGESARFGTPGVSIGLFCSTPMVALSRAVPSKTALRMLLTGDLLDACTALQRGLVSDVVADAELESAAAELAAKVAAASSATVAIGKKAFYEQIQLTTAEAYGRMSEVMADNAVMHDAQEGIDAFLTKRDPQWRGRTH